MKSLVFSVKGACGIVYLVYSHETKSAYALKTFRDEYLEDVTTRERFKKRRRSGLILRGIPYLVRASLWMKYQAGFILPWSILPLMMRVKHP